MHKQKGMKYFTWKYYIISVFLAYLFFVIILWYYLDSRCPCIGSEMKKETLNLAQEIIYGHKGENISSNTTNSDISSKLLVLIRDFEFFENDLPETVKSVLNIFPLIKILILTDKSPYPPLKVAELPNVRIINLNPILRKFPTDLCLSHIIDKEHILILPDSVRIRSASQIIDMFKSHTEKPQNIIAVSVTDQDTSHCLHLNVSLRHWTLKYRENTVNKFICDALFGKYILFLTKSLMNQFNFAFARPFPHSLFIQSSLFGIKVQVLKDIFIQNGKSLYTDPHNQWKRDSLEDMRKQTLYRNLGIKKVILPASKVEWYGCRKDTARCFGTVLNDMPEYLVEGRWTPPCCLENLRQTTRYVFSILEKCSVRYWLEGGSLLGAARNGDIIPYDYDVDIGIYQDDIMKCEWLKNSLTQSIIDNQGFVWETAKEGNFIRVQFSQTNHLHVDIFPFYSKNGTMTKDTWFPTHKQDTEFPEHYLKPLSKLKFVGVRASVPNNYRKFLELKFGKGAIEVPKYPVDEALTYFKREKLQLITSDLRQ